MSRWRASALWLVVVGSLAACARLPPAHPPAGGDGAAEGHFGQQLRIEELESRLLSLEEECRAHRQQAQQEMAACERRVAELERELEVMRSRLALAVEQVTRRDATIAQRDEEIAALDALVDEQQDRLTTLESEIEEIQMSALSADSTWAPADVVVGGSEPVAVELFYATNRQRAGADSGASDARTPAAGRFWPSGLVLPALMLALYLLLPPPIRKFFKPEYASRFVLGARVLCGVVLAVAVYAAVRSRIVDEAPAYVNVQLADGERNYELGRCTVTIPPVHQRARVEDLSFFEFRRDPTKHFTLQQVQPIDDAATFFAGLRATVQGGDLLLFVHGYNNTFTDAAFRTAQIHYDLGFEGAPMFFSWPSADGNYQTSEANVDGAWRSLAGFLEEVLERSEASNVRLLAHSMGSRVLSRAIEKLLDTRPDLFDQPRFDEVVLAAPDIKLTNYRDVAIEILPAVANMTVYASSKDSALLASQLLHGGEPRAGQAPPPLVVEGVDTLDVSQISSGHSYVADSGTVLDHLRLLLTGRRGEVVLDETTARRAAASEGGEYWILLPPEAGG